MRRLARNCTVVAALLTIAMAPTVAEANAKYRPRIIAHLRLEDPGYAWSKARIRMFPSHTPGAAGSFVFSAKIIRNGEVLRDRVGYFNPNEPYPVQVNSRTMEQLRESMNVDWP